MIINHPGCEVLNALLINFAMLLRSYGATIRLPLIEDEDVNNAGGIGAYFTRVLEQCDYVLLVFSQGALKGT